MNEYTIGVDISKAFFDSYRSSDGKTGHFSNDRQGFKAFVRWLDGLAIERIVYEPTGKYHFGFEDFLSTAGLPLCKVNPLSSRRFAQATGTRAKTDRVDARVLAIMGESLQIEPGEVIENPAPAQGIADCTPSPDQGQDGCQKQVKTNRCDFAQAHQCYPVEAN